MTVSRRPLVATCAALLVGAALLAPTAAGAAPPATLEVDLDRLPTGEDGLVRAIVAYRDGAVTQGSLALLDRVGVTRGIELSTIGAVAVTAPAAAVQALAAADPRIVAVEPQRRLQLDLYASKEMIDAVGVDEPESYTATVGQDRGEVERPGVTGAGIGVAVLDSGIFAPHPDFGERVAGGYHFAFSEIQDTGGISYEEWDAYAESTGPIAMQDEIGHGTHVASTVGGDGSLSADAGGPDLAGVAPGVTFHSYKVADAPFGIVDDIDWEEAALAAFDHVIRKHEDLGIHIAQNSWGLLPAEPDCLGAGCGEPTDFDAMQEMIAAVEDAGVHVVFSAGNSGPEPGTIGAYHSADRAILVGAACKSVDSTRCEDGQRVVDFSSRGAEDGTGPQIDVLAPGDTIEAAVSPSVLLPLTECPEFQQPGYYCISGTSMASPHVSGVVALMLEANPDLGVEAVKECLYTTATDDPDTPAIDEGHGMVDTRAAIECAHARSLTAADLGAAPDAPAPAEGDAPAPAPAAPVTPVSRDLPSTGGGAAVAGLLALAAVARRRR